MPIFYFFLKYFFFPNIYFIFFCFSAFIAYIWTKLPTYLLYYAAVKSLWSVAL